MAEQGVSIFLFANNSEAHAHVMKAGLIEI